MKIVLKAKKHAALLSYKSGYGYKHYGLLKKLNTDQIFGVYETTKKWDNEEAIGEEKLAKLIIEDKVEVLITEFVIWINKLIKEGLVVVTSDTGEEVKYLTIRGKKSIEVVYQSESGVLSVKKFLKVFTFKEVQ